MRLRSSVRPSLAPEIHLCQVSLSLPCPEEEWRGGPGLLGKSALKRFIYLFIISHHPTTCPRLLVRRENVWLHLGASSDIRRGRIVGREGKGDNPARTVTCYRRDYRGKGGRERGRGGGGITHEITFGERWDQEEEQSWMRDSPNFALSLLPIVNQLHRILLRTHVT